MKNLIFLLLLLVPLSSNAFEIISVDSVNVNVSYIEPTLNVDNSPLSDLDHTSIYYIVDGVTTKAMDVPATSSGGGGTVQIQVPVPIGDGQEADVEFYATAVDIAGNEGPPSNRASLRIDRLAPAAPQ